MNALIDLDGVATARAFVTPTDEGPAVGLTICAASGFNDGRYFPAEAISLDSLDAIQRLHTLLGEMLEAAA